MRTGRDAARPMLGLPTAWQRRGVELAPLAGRRGGVIPPSTPAEQARLCLQGRVPGAAYFFSPASLRSSSARSVFSHENAVAVCLVPALST